MSDESELYDRLGRTRRLKNSVGAGELKTAGGDRIRREDPSALQLHCVSGEDLAAALQLPDPEDSGSFFLDGLAQNQTDKPRYSGGFGNRLTPEALEIQRDMLRAAGYGSLDVRGGRIMPSVLYNDKGELLVRDSRTGDYYSPEQIG